MPRRKPIGINLIGSRLNNYPTNNNILNVRDILDPIMALRNRYAADALAVYNADNYASIQNLPTEGQLMSIQQPDALRVTKPVIDTSNYRKPTIKKTNNSSKDYTDGNSFVNTIYDSYYRAVRPGAKSDADAARQAKFLTQKAAFETGYGGHLANTHNYGGHRINGKWLAFNSMDDFTRRDVSLLDRKWGNWRNAKNENDFVTSITTNQGKGAYAPRHEYQGYFNLTNRTNNYLNMGKRRLRYGGQINRPKAWVGAAISAATSLLGGVLSVNAQKRQLEAQRRAQGYQNTLRAAQQMNQSLSLMRDAQKEYENRFRVNYKNGGRVKADLGFILPILGNLGGSLVDEFTTKTDIPNNNVDVNTNTLDERNELMCGGRRKLRDGVRITDGGYGIPIGRNTFLLRGGLHEDINETGQTGIGMKVGNKVFEAENNEVVQKTPKEVRVFSDSIILPNGMTPAEAVENGYNKNVVFNIQQDMNGDYGISNKRRLRNGGRATRPVERMRAADGIKVDRNGRRYRTETGRRSDGSWYERMVYLDDENTSGTVYSKRGGGNPSVASGGVRGNNTSNRTSSNGNNSNRTQSNRISSGRVYANSNGFSNGNVSGGVRGTNTNYDVWTGRDGKTYYGRITRNENGNTYNIVGEGTPPNTNRNTRSSSNSTSNNGWFTRLRNNVSNRLNQAQTQNNASNSDTDVYYSDYVPTNGQGNTNAGTNRRTLALRGASRNSSATKAVNTSMPSPNLSDIGTVSAIRELNSNNYNPDYTSEQELDYIRRNAPGLNNNQDTRSYTNPAEAELRQYQADVAAGTAPGNSSGGNINNQAYNNQNRLGMVTKGADWIGLGADLLGGIGSSLINYFAARNYQDPIHPVLNSPAKLITNYNIAPRLSKLAETRSSMLRDSDEAVSSAGRLDRRNRINLLTNSVANQLYGEKTNKETELLNADALNQQSFHRDNVNTINNYYRDLVNSRNTRSLMRSQALLSGLNGISDAVGNFLDQGKQRYSDQQAMRYYMALLNDEGRQWLMRNGIDFLRRGSRI